MIVNGIFWTLGMEDAIKPDLDVSFVGPFEPNTFGGGAYAHGVKPEMYAGFTTQIPANNNTKSTKKAKAEVKPAAKSDSAAKVSLTTGKPARYVRIELPGDKRTLTLAEVEVMSGGKNVAKGGKATQSTTAGGISNARRRGVSRNGDLAGALRAGGHFEQLLGMLVILGTTAAVVAVRVSGQRAVAASC